MLRCVPQSCRTKQCQAAGVRKRVTEAVGLLNSSLGPFGDIEENRRLPMPKRDAGQAVLEIRVAAPVRNGALTLPALLDSLARQTVRPDR